MGVAIAAWESGLVSRKVRSTETISLSVAGKIYHAEIRVIDVPSRGRRSSYGATAKEIKLPDGRWADCHSDCKKVFARRVDGGS